MTNQNNSTLSCSLATMFMAALCTGSELRAQWTVTILNPADAAGSVANSQGSGQQAGAAWISNGWRAGVWSGTAASWVSLHPPTASQSAAHAASEGHQAGVCTVAGREHAALWNGTAASWVDLHPDGHRESKALALGGGKQAGYSRIERPGLGLRTYAILWSGTGNSWVNLHPAGLSELADSAVLAMSGNQQAGYVEVSARTHASLWSGTAGSWIDLHPVAGTEGSRANAAHDGQQGGWVYADGRNRASLWSGTAASWVDLHPGDAVQSEVLALTSGRQVGYVNVGNVQRASLWSGTADSWVDLHQFLPARFTGSMATGVSRDGDTLFVTGNGYSEASNPEAVLWTVQICAPTNITVHPQSITTCRTTAATFTIAATGDGPLVYHWRKAGVPIDPNQNPTAETDTLELPHVQPADAGAYDCIVTNTCGTSVTSNPATLSTRLCVCLMADVAGGGPDGLEGDGIIDGSDFIAFINSFAAGDVNTDPRADVAGGGLVGLDPDGIIDGTDFIVFINVFSAGC